MNTWTFFNNDFVADKNAKLHYRDLSFQRGYGVFDFLRLVGNRPLFLTDHLQRFLASAAEMRLSCSLQTKDLTSVIQELIAKNNRSGTGIRLALTGGLSEDGFTPGTPTLLISQPAFSSPSEAERQQGIRLLSHPHQRQLPHVKSIDYMMAVWLQPLKAESGADDFLYHSNGFITECPRSNFFLVTGDDRIVTPAKGVLHGVTRKYVMALAKEHYRVEEREVRLEEIITAKEAFITSTTKQILRVAKIDDKVFSQSSVTTHLLGLFWSACYQPQAGLSD